MIRILTSILLIAPMLALSSEKCIPKNDLYIPHWGIKGIESVEEKEFNDAIDAVEKIYKPIFKKDFKANLVVERKWDDGTVNAYAYRRGANWHVAMFGGLARHKETTQDGFMAVICHEIGHHIGGAPKKRGLGSWASNEGQSDYFATTKCLRKVFEKQQKKTLQVYYAQETDQENLFAKNKCEINHQTIMDSAVCYRAALAGKSLARLLGSLRNTPDVKFSTPDMTVVASTNDNHPVAQCRMDTYFQGSLCIKDHLDDPSQTDASIGYCMRKDGFQSGIRPLCWYKPE